MKDPISWRQPSPAGALLQAAGTLRFAAIAPAVFLLLASGALAQTSTGAISVTVTDASGSIVPGASISVTGSDTGATIRQTQTNGAGIAAIPLVPPGRYNVDVSMPGFTGVRRQDLDIEVGATVSLNIALQVGQASESVTVTGQTPLVEDKSQTVQQVIESKELTDIPLNGRNYLQAANFIPGVVPQTAGRDNSFVAYGNSGLQNAFLLDGARNVNYLRGLDNDQRDMIRPPLDALSEFTVQTSNYSAEFGASAGAVVNAVTRSGTNRWHGSAYDFIRNSAADAKAYFSTAATAKALLVRNQYGGSLGGPILRDKLFFFAAYEGTHNRSDGYGQTQVPSLLERQGNFSQSNTPIYDPATTTASGSTYTRQPFAGNVLPADRINPLGQSLVNLYPMPNLFTGGTYYYASNIPSLLDSKNAIGRIDYTASVKDSLFVRWAQTNTSNFQGVGIPGAQDPNNVEIDAKGIGVGYTRVFTENLVDELRFAWTTVSDTAAGTNPRNEIIPGLLDPAITQGSPTISVQNKGRIGSESVNNSPYGKTSGVFDWADNFSWSHGTQLIKFGGEVMWIRPRTEAALGGRGSLGFTGVFTQDPQRRSRTGNGVADLLLGDANSVSAGTTLLSEERGWYYAGYFNDQWTAMPHLTLNLGLRYEYMAPFYDTQNREGNFVLDPGPLFGQLILAGDPRLPRALVYGDTNNVAPRLGFSYRLPGTGESSLRGSYGVFYAQDQGSGISDRLSSNPPYYNYGGINLSSDQLHPSTGFVLSPTASIARPTPINPAAFALPSTFTGGLTSWPLHLRTGYVQEWSLSFEKQLPSRILLEVNYVGNHGVHLPGRAQGNQPTVLNGTTVQSRRPLFAITQSGVNAVGDWNATQYEGLSAKVEKRLTNEFFFRNSFTYGHGFDLQNQALDVCDTCGNSDTIQNAYDHAANWGSSDTDVRFRYALTGLWEPPIGPGKAWLAHQRVLGAMLGGFAFSPIYVWETGLPFTPGLSTDLANAGTLTRPNQVCNPNRGARRTPQQWFNTSCIVAPPNYTFGNLGKNTVRAPGQNRLDLSIERNFPVPRWESANLRIRIDSFNTLNHVQWGAPNATLGNSNFGQITSAEAQRQLQAAARLTF